LGGQLFTTVASRSIGAVLNTVATNIFTPPPNWNGDIFAGFGADKLITNIEFGIGSLVGGYLARQIVDIDTQAAAIGASLGRNAGCKPKAHCTDATVSQASGEDRCNAAIALLHPASYVRFATVASRTIGRPSAEGLRGVWSAPAEAWRAFPGPSTAGRPLGRAEIWRRSRASPGRLAAIRPGMGRRPVPQASCTTQYLQLLETGTGGCRLA
jgi:hypothetical protein